MIRTEVQKSSASPVNAWTTFVKGRDRLSRGGALNAMRKSGGRFPICLAEDLLLLDLTNEEKCSILNLTHSDHPAAFEHFLTRYLFDWTQDLSALAVRIWSERTDHLLWFRFVNNCISPHLPQRVLYTVVENAHATGGAQLLIRTLDVEGLPNLSSAFHGLLLHRAVQWSVSHPVLAALSQRILMELNSQYHPEHKAIPSAVAYLLRFHPEEAPNEVARVRESPWREILVGLLARASNSVDQIDKLMQTIKKTRVNDRHELLYSQWPPFYRRASLPVDLVKTALAIEPGATTKSAAFDWTLFAGIPESTLLAAVAKIDEDDIYTRALSTIHPLLSLPYRGNELQAIRERVSATSPLLPKLPKRLQLALHPVQDPVLRSIEEQQAVILAAQTHRTEVDSDESTDIIDWTEADHSSEVVSALNLDRKIFFQRAFNSRAIGKTMRLVPKSDGFWQLLTRAWEHPEGHILTQMAQAARPIDGIFRLCYITTLGRFRGDDQAALKLLDFIRTKDEDELRAVIFALAGIGTSRALQELVATLTRPNVTIALQLEICSLLSKADVTNLQSEIRSAIKDKIEKSNNPASSEVREALAELLTPIPNNQDVQSKQVATLQSDTELDAMLAAKIRYYKELSSEVKRALRTSQFFHIQVSFDDSPESIDLSPVIDMQYKALELLFRESFEEHCSELIQRGVLQRRLDVIGYARPNPRAMNDFEDYIGSLPVIREIPFFSKFKLRKTLRAICQFRPGKRFTLDGLKAFALFFLCFGRTQCRYGLEGLFALGFKNDEALFEFVKVMHVMQDFRNRAAHEGFHPDASNDIDGIWRDTSQIIQLAFELRQFLDGSVSQEVSAKKSNELARSVIIERKKVS